MTESRTPPIAYASAAPVESADESHLKILTICHWVAGGLMLVFGCFPIVHVVIGILLLTGRMGNGSSDDVMSGWLFAGIGLALMLVLWTGGVLVLASAQCMRMRRRRVFSMVAAGAVCLWMPIGTVLGVFTLIVLSRDSVKRLYGEAVAG